MAFFSLSEMLWSLRTKPMLLMSQSLKPSRAAEISSSNILSDVLVSFEMESNRDLKSVKSCIGTSR